MRSQCAATPFVAKYRKDHEGGGSSSGTTGEAVGFNLVDDVIIPEVNPPAASDGSTTADDDAQ